MTILVFSGVQSEQSALAKALAGVHMNLADWRAEDPISYLKSLDTALAASCHEDEVVITGIQNILEVHHIRNRCLPETVIHLHETFFTKVGELSEADQTLLAQSDYVVAPMVSILSRVQGASS